MAMVGALMGEYNIKASPMREKKIKLHWKERQSDSEREEKIRKAEEKRQRKAEKRGKNA